MSNKYIIQWNTGYGDDHEVIEAENQEEADKIAYEAWHEEAQNNADYSAMEYTQELAEEYGLEDDEESE